MAGDDGDPWHLKWFPRVSTSASLWTGTSCALLLLPVLIAMCRGIGAL